jgi:hypothetical protein
MFLAVKCQHALGACQSHSRPVLSLCEASWKYVDFSHKKSAISDTLFPQERSIAYSEATPSSADTPSTKAYSFSPLKVIQVTGQLDDLVSLLCWEVIVDVMDDSTYKLVAFGATSSLGQKVC